ncbi:MAG TPA: hypothetical protein VM010_04640 [Chitinophagaceae bacterium]|nr:hypothetical protein [Chitinophagaceae bacterium]
MYRCVFLLLVTFSFTHIQAQTFNNDVAPIIQAKCAYCHKPGEAAPFTLLTYEDIAKRATFIKKVVESRYMPPWKADDNYVSFAHNRSLSNNEIKTISDWVKAGVPKGKGEAKKITVLEGTAYDRKPDLSLKVKEPYTVPGDNYERFIVYKIPFELPDSANVQAVEFFSNDKKIVHHANFAVHAVLDTSINIYNTADMLNLTEDDRRKYDQYLPYKKTMTYYGGWIPGSSPQSFPKGFGWVLPKRGVILLTIHYSPLAKPEESISGVNLFFTKAPIARKIKVISFGSGGIGEKSISPRFHYIPANKVSNYTLEIVNPAESEAVFYVWPHMHLIGKTFKSYAVSPTGDTIRLVHIPDWDFRWQEVYKLKKPAILPKGSKLVIEASYDNTAENPFNPNTPPRQIISGGDMKSDEEMMTLLLIYVPYQPGDETIEL